MDHPRHARAKGRVDDVRRPLDVRRHQARAVAAPSGAEGGGDVVDVRHAAHRLVDGGRIGDVAEGVPDRRGGLAEQIDGRTLAPEDADGLALRDEQAGERGADESGGAGDEGEGRGRQTERATRRTRR